LPLAEDFARSQQREPGFGYLAAFWGPHRSRVKRGRDPSTNHLRQVGTQSGRWPKSFRYSSKFSLKFFVRWTPDLRRVWQAEAWAVCSKKNTL